MTQSPPNSDYVLLLSLHFNEWRCLLFLSSELPWPNILRTWLSNARVCEYSEFLLACSYTNVKGDRLYAVMVESLMKLIHRWIYIFNTIPPLILWSRTWYSVSGMTQSPPNSDYVLLLFLQCNEWRCLIKLWLRLCYFVLIVDIIHILWILSAFCGSPRSVDIIQNLWILSAFSRYCGYIHI